VFSSPGNHGGYLSSSVLDLRLLVDCCSFHGVGCRGDAATAHATGKIRLLVISVHLRAQSMALLK
jgi:hypothetical protein